MERALTGSPDTRAVIVRALAELAMAPESYVELLAAVPPERRPDGVRLLWQVGGRAVIPQIHGFLEDPSAQVRLAALEVLGESGDPGAGEVARAVLDSDSSPVVRATAIRAIARAGLDQRESSLARALSDPDPDVRAMAVEVLPSGFGGQAGRLLLQALSDEDDRVWRAAIAQLAEVPDRDRGVVWTAIVQSLADRREELLSTLERTKAERLASLALEHLTDPDPEQRTLAIELAVRSGTTGGARAMISAVQDPAPAVRRTAVGAVARVGSPDAIPALAGCLYDPDVEVRVEAVRGLAHIDNDDVLSPLISALKDPEVRVRDVAADALIQWRSPAVARRLVVALTQPAFRRPAGEVLARMGSAAVEPLVDLLLEEGSELSETVGSLLRDLVGPEPFLERLGSMDAAERLRAVEVLGALGDDQGLDGLTRALSDPVESIRIRAVTHLGESGDPRAFDAVKRTFLGDPVEEVVAAAEDALKKLQPGA
jgi:HEAT repeat protein